MVILSFFLLPQLCFAQKYSREKAKQEAQEMLTSELRQRYLAMHEKNPIDISGIEWEIYQLYCKTFGVDCPRESAELGDFSVLFHGKICYDCDSVVYYEGRKGLKKINKDEFKRTLVHDAIDFYYKFEREIDKKTKELQKEDIEGIMVELAAFKSFLRSSKINEDHSKIKEYDTFCRMSESIEKGELYFVTKNVNGDTYKGWVNTEGLPQGIFKKTKPDGSSFSSAFVDGKAFAFGDAYRSDSNSSDKDIKERIGTHLVGALDNGAELNGLGFKIYYKGFFSDLNHQFSGYLFDGMPEGIGAFNDGKNLSVGTFEKGNLVLEASEIAQAEYNKNAPIMLDKSVRVVENMDLMDGRHYTGNWKNGEPFHYGLIVQEDRGWYGSLLGDKENYRLWQKEPGCYYQEQNTTENAKYHLMVSNKTISKSIETINKKNSLQYDYVMHSGEKTVRGWESDAVTYRFYMGKIPFDTIVYVGPDELVISVVSLVVNFGDLDGKLIKRWAINLNGDRLVQSGDTTMLVKHDGNVYVYVYNNNSIQYDTDGQIYVGSMEYNKDNWEMKKTGSGSLFFDDGELIVEGYWFDDKMSNKEPLNDKTRQSHQEAIVKAVKALPKYKPQKKNVMLSPTFSLPF